MLLHFSTPFLPYVCDGNDNGDGRRAAYRGTAHTLLYNTHNYTIQLSVEQRFDFQLLLSCVDAQTCLCARFAFVYQKVRCQVARTVVTLCVFRRWYLSRFVVVVCAYSELVHFHQANFLGKYIQMSIKIL